MEPETLELAASDGFTRALVLFRDNGGHTDYYGTLPIGEVCK